MVALQSEGFIMQAHASVVGLDIARSVFQVHAADNFGRPVIRRKLKRQGVESFFRALAPCLVETMSVRSRHVLFDHHVAERIASS